MRQSLCMLLLLVGIASLCEAQTTLTSGKLAVKLDPKEGVTQITLDGQTLLTGSSTRIDGSLFTLLRDTPTRQWNWPQNRTTPHFAPSTGKLIDKVGHWSKHTVKTIRVEPDRYVIKHHYDKGIDVTFDHQLHGTDISIRISIDNQTQDQFQLHDWLLFFIKTYGHAKITHAMGNYYPAGDTFSPVTTISDDKWGMGINWVKHDLRPVQIRLNPRQNSGDYQLETWLKNSPIPAQSCRSYTIVLRIDNTPGDWKNLLEPYHQWFTSYFGPAQYSMDFRVKVGVFCCARERVSPINPLGYMDQLDRQGWLPFLKRRLGHLQGMNTGQVILWGATGINPRGVNYRPDFDVLPQVLEDGLPQLAPFFQAMGNKSFGFFARPNTIAYQQSNTQDADVSFNPLDNKHVRMADRRYERLVEQGASAFYMDTFGADWGNFPDAAKASVYYLKHLRDKFGPDMLLVTEFGFDAFAVYASIWPNRQDKSGHIPYGNYARWLVPGSVDFCRVYELAGAQRAWERGAVPMLNDFAVNSQVLQLQSQYVNPDGSSKVRTDCLKPVIQEKHPAREKTTGSDDLTKPVDSLFKR